MDLSKVISENPLALMSIIKTFNTNESTIPILPETALELIITDKKNR